MENLFVSLAQSEIQTTQEHNDIENSRRGATNVSSGNGKLPDISCRKIRERLIHLLALKPSKKFEIYAHLQKEGIRKTEKLLVDSILTEIALLRDNVYSLSRYTWKEVNEKWPYYTEQEQQQLKFFKTQNLSYPINLKHPSSEKEEDEPAKKQDDIHASADICLKTCKQVGTDTNSINQDQTSVMKTTSEVSAADHPVIDEVGTDTPKYDLTYSTFEILKQRCQCKYFDGDYEDCFTIMRRVKEVRRTLRVLCDQLQNVPIGSSECKRIEGQIIAEYERLKSKEEIQDKRRSDCSKGKLVHINQLMKDFYKKLQAEKAVHYAVAAESNYQLQRKQAEEKNV